MALEDVKIIDLTEGLWGAMATAWLADFGAEVIMLETLEGSPDRKLDPMNVSSAKGTPPLPRNLYFPFIDRNKKSIAVNMESDQGKNIVHALVSKVNVFATNLPQALLKKGLDYSTLARVNPRLIYASASGFGQYGPDKDLPSIDQLAASRAGLMVTLPQSTEVPPTYTGVGEPITTMLLALGIMLALFHQKRTGEGQEVHVSLFGGNIYFSHCCLTAYLATFFRGVIPPILGANALVAPLSRKDWGNPLLNVYSTRDKWISLGILQTDKSWHSLCEAVGIEHLEHDPRFDSHEKRCVEHKKELIDILDQIFPGKSSVEWLELLRGRGIMVDVISDFSDCSNDPQAITNEFIIELRTIEGILRMLGFPILLKQTPSKITQMAPALGQHTRNVLMDLLGYTYDKVMQLKQDKIID